MEQEVTQTTPDAFDAAVTTSASTYADAAVTTTDTDVETPAEQAAASRDDKGRFAAQKAEAVDDAVVETSAKPVAKPRNDPQARIDQVIAKQKEADRRAEDAERKVRELEARLAPKPAPVAAAPSTDAAPDAADATKYPGGEYDPKFLKDQARYEARQEFREQHAAQQAADEDTRKERDFDTRATSFVTRLKDANAVESIDRRLLSGKPLSLLTSKERAEIAKLPPQEQSDLGFICFLADQWDGSEHDIALVKYLSDPKTFQRLATLPPNQVIRELARVEAGFGAASPKERGPAPKPSASQAHAPITPLGTAPHASADDTGSDDESIERHFARENAKDRKAGRL